jgi:hypothetical protein
MQECRAGVNECGRLIWQRAESLGPSLTQRIHLLLYMVEEPYPCIRRNTQQISRGIKSLLFRLAHHQPLERGDGLRSVSHE